MWSTSPWPRSFHFGALRRVRGRLRFTTASTLASAKYFKVWIFMGWPMPPFSSSTPCGDTPHGDTPCGDTPCGDTPGGEALLSLAFEADQPHSS